MCQKCDSLEEKIDLCEKGYKWSWSKALIGIWKSTLASEKFWVFAVFTIMMFLQPGTDALGYWITYAAVCGCFMFHTALANLIFNGKLRVEAKANLGISKEIKEEK